MNVDALLQETLRQVRSQADISPEWVQRNRLHLEALIRSKLRPLGGDRIVTLNMGLGRDSLAMLCLLLERKLLAQATVVNVPDISAVIFSDTGYEWQHTYAVLPLTMELCLQAGLRWLHLRKPPAEGQAGWMQWQNSWQQRRIDGPSRERPPWQQEPPASIEARASSGYYHLRAPILDDYQTRATVISVNRQDCTANHKIGPIRRVIEDLANERFQVESNREWGRDVRASRRRPHLSLIGYAANEQSRLGHEGGVDYAEEAYPLVEMGIAKMDETAILERWHLDHVRKSGCMLCPYQPVSWYWALREVDLDAFWKIEEYERRALERNPRMTVMPGRKPLAEAVNAWRQANPDATVEQVLTKAYNRCRPKNGVGCEERLDEPVLSPDTEQVRFLAIAQARVLLRMLGKQPNLEGSR